MRELPLILVLSCEHAGNRVPARYRQLFRRQPSVLETHRAYDLGIYPIAEKVARRLHCPLFAFFVTRLLIDANRSPGHRHLLSDFSRDLPVTARQRLIETYYQPYRRRVMDAIEQHTTRGRCVLHVSLHSFVPVLGSQIRKADVGILYDAKRLFETRFARRLQRKLANATGLRVRRNYPYRGAADGFVTFLRRRFTESSYAGLELELNQRLLEEGVLATSRPSTGGLVDAISASLFWLVENGSEQVFHCLNSERSGAT